MPTIRKLLHESRRALAPHSDSPQLDAALLLGAVVGLGRAALLAHDEREVAPAQAAHFRTLVARRVAGEPVAYLLGQRDFFGRTFQVDRRVLIPRPETELLVERALARLAAHPTPRIVDVGTGSGAIAVTLAAERPDARVIATDLSPDALAVARENAARLDAVVDFREGWLLDPLIPADLPLDLLAANLPYVSERDRHRLAVDVLAYEPHLALFAGSDGLDLIRALLAAVTPALLAPGGAILLEIGYDQGPALARLASDHFPGATVRVHPDLAGHDRLVEIVP